MRKLSPLLSLISATALAASLVSCSDSGSAAAGTTTPTSTATETASVDSTGSATAYTADTSGSTANTASSVNEVEIAYSDWIWAPGAVIHLDRVLGGGSGRCTTSFSFSDSSGNYDRYYAITSGHCGYLGDLVYAEDPSYGYPPVGKVVYSAWADYEGGSQHSPYDWAIIQITDPHEPVEQVANPEDISNAVALSPIPSGEVVGIGSTTGIQDGWIDSGQVERTVNLTGPDNNVSRGIMVDICSRPGDSGGPKMFDTGDSWAVFAVTSWGNGSDTAETPCRSSGDTAGVTPTWAFMDEVMSMYPNSSIQTTTISVN